MKTKKQYEEDLNHIYTPDQAIEIGCYMKKATNLLHRAKYGTALRKYDPIAFEVGYYEKLAETW